ncbi:hypothetical protein IGI37_002731 [Enterococcus sp. AZ194]|uniref:HAD-IIB family hydrolase n=1 Tax=Enterococcus sp. AZ194 TaxID=2774629 RepID=UPI003F260A20
MNIVFADIDGTFQGMGAPVPQINIDAVTELQKRGDHFVFVTGRGYGLVEPLQKELGLDCDVIFGNGAGLKEIGKKATYRNCLSLPTLKKMLPILDELNILYFIHTDDEVLMQPIDNYRQNLQELRESMTFMGDKGTMLMDFKTNYFEKDCHHVSDIATFLEEHPERVIVKVELMEASEEKHQLLREKLSSADTYVFESYVKTLEIVNPLSTKGAAIQSYLKKFSDVTSYGLGDGENDLAMLEVVDVAVAVENATDRVKEKSHRIAPSCEEGGVGKFIFEEILNKNNE